MPNEPKSFPSVIPWSSTVFTHSVCFSHFCVLLGSKGPERTERLALETSEESIEKANNGIKGHLGMNSTLWYLVREAALATDALRSPRYVRAELVATGLYVPYVCVFSRAALYWDRLGDGDGKERSDQTSSSPKAVTTRRQVLLSRCRLWSSTRRGRLN